MGRKIYTQENWMHENQENYRVNKALELAQKVFQDASYNPNVSFCLLGIRFKDETATNCCYSLNVDLKGNGIWFREPKYKSLAERLADTLETDKRLGKFVLVKKSSVCRTVYTRGPAPDTSCEG